MRTGPREAHSAPPDLLAGLGGYFLVERGRKDRKMDSKRGKGRLQKGKRV